jgi:RHS repeat-associated protein
MKAGGQYYFYHNDHLGTPQKLASASGAIGWSAVYDAFGKASVNAGSTVTNNLRFPGQYQDAETGLYYNYHRYYDPRTGRYVTADPIGLEGGVNPFAYALNNPLNLIDLLGLEVLSLPGYGGVQSMIPTDLNFKEREPDYYAFSVSFPFPHPDAGMRELMGLTIQIEVDKYGNWYWAFPGVSAGAARYPVSASIIAGWIESRKPCERETIGFLSGGSVNFGGGFVLGGGKTYIHDKDKGVISALELGIYSPQIGFNSAYSTQLNK